MKTAVEKLAEIRDEVRELHPLLHRLFRAINEVTEIEHTHGSREMGADFVLAKTDHVWEASDYIGVIAKTESIRQDFSDIDRQIEECALPRLFRGKERIRLNEIWVITTGTISKNAQEKLEHKYNSSKIRFIGRDGLIGLIDRHIPDFWNEVEDGVGEYLTTLRSKNEESDRKYSLVPFEEGPFYIEQDLIRIEEEPYRRNPRRGTRRSTVRVFEEIEKHDVVLVEGGMGSGKSKLLRQIVSHYSTPGVFVEEKVLPIPTSFKQLIDDYGGDIHALIQARLASGLPEGKDDGTYLLLIDAVDEKDLSIEDQLEQLSAIRGAVAGDKRVKAVITSRHLRGLEHSNPLSRSLARYEIKPLSINRLIEFLTKLCSSLSLSTRLVEDLKKSALFRDLPRSPIAAILLAQLLRENAEDLPSNLTELYSKYTELMLGRWDLEKGLQSQKEYEALDSILMQIASYMMQHELATISLEEAKGFFRDYLKERNLNLRVDGLFEKLRTRSELVVVDEPSMTFSFKHRTFAEFMAAKRMLRGSVQIDQRAYQTYWMNTFFFAVGLKKDAPDLIKALIELQPDTEGGRWMKFINLSNYLMAAYTTPYSLIEEGVYRASVEAAEVYIDTASGRTPCPIGPLPRMHLLFLFQFIIRNGYSFEFLARAIDSAGLRIATETGLDEIRPYALFFLNVARIELKSGGDFDFMLRELSSALPVDVTLAIHHESQDIKERSKLLRKHEKRVNDILKARYEKGTRALDTGIRELYEHPIKSR